MKSYQVKQFWEIYKSREFKKEVQSLFNKVKQYSSFVDLDKHYPRKVVGLAVNRSPSFVSKSLSTYNHFVQSLKKKTISLDTLVSDLIIFVPKFQRLIEALEKSKFTVEDLFKRERFWNLHIKGIGPKSFAYLLYCLEYHGLTIRKARWCKK